MNSIKAPVRLMKNFASTDLADKLITKKNFPDLSASDLKYEKMILRERLDSLDIDKSMTPREVYKHPKFNDLNDDIQLLISSLAVGKSSNKEFIKLYLDAIRNFDMSHYDYRSTEELMQGVLCIKDSMDRDVWPNNYYGLPYAARTKLKALIEAYKIVNTLSSEELITLRKALKPIYDKCINKTLTDENYEKWIKEKFEEFHPSSDILKLNFKHSAPDLFEFLKSKLSDLNEGITDKEWKDISVESKMVGSTHSAVVSSSFSTDYHYSLVIKVLGKTFKYDDVVLGSSYYSGGW